MLNTNQRRRRIVYLCLIMITIKNWWSTSLIPQLKNRFHQSVVTKEDIDFGALILEEHLSSIMHCEYLIFVFSTSFLVDQDCCKFAVRAFLSDHKHDIVSLILAPLTFDDMLNNETFSSLIINNDPFIWPINSVEENQTVWGFLEERFGCMKREHDIRPIVPRPLTMFPPLSP